MPFRKDNRKQKKGVDMTLDGDLDGKFVFNTLDCIGEGNFGKIYRGQWKYCHVIIHKSTPRLLLSRGGKKSDCGSHYRYIR